jgi:prolyl 4-hydroxylase
MIISIILLIVGIIAVIVVYTVRNSNGSSPRPATYPTFSRPSPSFITPAERTSYEKFPLFTREGYRTGKLPYHLREWLSKEWREKRKRRKKEEIDDHTAKYVVAGKKAKHAAYMVELSPEIKQALEQFVLERLEEWTGLGSLEHTATYGVREYTDGAVLSSHVDRYETHILSAIIHVGSMNMRKPWSLEVYNRESPLQSIDFSDECDFVLYESSSLVHGRPEPLEGEIFANLFIHYAPKNWKQQLEKYNLSSL